MDSILTDVRYAMVQLRQAHAVAGVIAGSAVSRALDALERVEAALQERAVGEEVADLSAACPDSADASDLLLSLQPDEPFPKGWRHV